MTAKISAETAGDAKYRIQTVGNLTKETRQLDYKFVTIQQAVQILRVMASGGANKYQVYDVSTNKVVHWMFGRHYKPLH